MFVVNSSSLSVLRFASLPDYVDVTETIPLGPTLMTKIHSSNMFTIDLVQVTAQVTLQVWWRRHRCDHFRDGPCAPTMPDPASTRHDSCTDTTQAITTHEDGSSPRPPEV